MGNNDIRGFDPSAVKPEHIGKVVVLYGTDVDGIRLRLDTFAKLLPGVVKCHDVSKILQYVSSGGLFADDVFLIATDFTPMLKTQSSKELNAFISAVSSYGPDSRFVLACPGAKDSKQLRKLCDFAHAQHGTARPVMLPAKKQFSKWIQQYAASLGIELSPTTIAVVSSACGQDAMKAANAIDTLGEDIASISEQELSVWLGSTEKTNMRTFCSSIASHDVTALSKIRTGFPIGAVGDRLFLIKARYVVQDMLIASYGKRGTVAFSELNIARYGSYHPASGMFFRDQGIEAGGEARLIPLYLSLCSMIDSMTGCGGRVPSLDDCIMVLAS